MKRFWDTIYLVPSDIRVLEIYLLKNLKLPHDEFLYNEWLNSYHNHTYPRLGKLDHRLLALCWVWSTHVRPLSRGSPYSQDQDYIHSTQMCYFYPRSMQLHAFHLDPPKNVLFLPWEWTTKNISFFHSIKPYYYLIAIQ